MTTGDYVLLAALSRAVGATSETELGEWIVTWALGRWFTWGAGYERILPSRRVKR